MQSVTTAAPIAQLATSQLDQELSGLLEDIGSQISESVRLKLVSAF